MNTETTQQMPTFRALFAPALPTHAVMVMPRCTDIEASKAVTQRLEVCRG